MKNAAKAIELAVCLLISPDIAVACGPCLFQQTDYYVVPYTIVWSLGMAVWFLVLMAVCVGEKRLSLAASPCRHFLLAAFLTALAVVVGGAAAGPFPFMLLGFMAVRTTVKGFHPQNWPTLSKGLQIGLKAVSAAALVCMVAGGAFSIRTKMTRSDADYIIEWNGGVMLLEFTSHPEKHEATLREVLARTKNKHLAERVSAALAEIDKKKPKPPENAQ